MKPVCARPLSFFAEATPFVRELPARLPTRVLEGWGVDGLHARGDFGKESGCPGPARPARPVFAEQPSPKGAQSRARWRRALVPGPEQLFPFPPRPRPPAPRIPLTPAADYISAALNAGWALHFSLQMRSDIFTRPSQRVSRARGHRPIDGARPRGRRARRHPKPP